MAAFDGWTRSFVYNVSGLFRRSFVCATQPSKRGVRVRSEKPTRRAARSLHAKQSKSNQQLKKLKLQKYKGCIVAIFHFLSLPLVGSSFRAAAAQSEGCRHQHRMLLLNIEASLRRAPPPSCSSDGVLRFSWLISGDFSSENVQFCGHHWARWVGGASAVCGWQVRVRRRPRRTQSGA